MSAALEQRVRTLEAQLRLLVSRAAVRLVDDSKKFQVVQADLLSGKTRDGIEHFQEYGFTSRTRPADATMGPEGIGLAVGGSRAHEILIAVGDRRYRLRNLVDGEVALYDDLGQKVHLTRTGIVVDGGGNPVTISNASKLRVEGDLEVTGKADITGDIDTDGDVNAGGDVEAAGDVSDLSGTAQSMAAMRTTFDLHIHPVPGNPNTGTPVPPLMS